jgi:hypothetical protein
MSSSGGPRAVVVLVLVAAFTALACTTQLGSEPAATRKPPRPAVTRVGPSPATQVFPLPGASPSPFVPASPIPIVRGLAYRGIGSVDPSSVRLRAGVYRASWAITGSDAMCVFRAELNALGRKRTDLRTLGQAPRGATIEGWDHIRVVGGAYELLVTAPSCSWKLDVVPIAGLD